MDPGTGLFGASACTHSIKYNILTGNKWLWFVDARRNSNRAVISVIIIPLVIIIKCVWTRDQRAKSKSRTNRSIGQRSLIKRVIEQVTGGINLEEGGRGKFN